MRTYNGEGGASGPTSSWSWNNGGLGDDLAQIALAGGGQAAQLNYTYDSTHRVTGFDTLVNGVESTLRPNAASSTTLNFDSSNRALLPPCPTTAAGCYDNNGNLTNDGTRTFTFDGEGDGRIVTARTSTATASYGYDPDGRRVSKTVNGTQTLYLMDATGQEVMELSGGQIQHFFMHSATDVAPVVVVDGGGGDPGGDGDDTGRIFSTTVDNDCPPGSGECLRVTPDPKPPALPFPPGTFIPAGGGGGGNPPNAPEIVTVIGHKPPAPPMPPMPPMPHPMVVSSSGLGDLIYALKSGKDGGCGSNTESSGQVTYRYAELSGTALLTAGNAFGTFITANGTTGTFESSFDGIFFSLKGLGVSYGGGTSNNLSTFSGANYNIVTSAGYYGQSMNFDTNTGAQVGESSAGSTYGLGVGVTRSVTNIITSSCSR